MKRLLTIGLLSIAGFSTYAQNEDIVAIVDDLTIKWDRQALQLETYTGLKYYCTSEKYRVNTIELLDKIHHYDTLLYGIVTRKYADTKDKEAEATLKDIIELEEEYTTANFKAFLEKECVDFTTVEENYTKEDSQYYKEVGKLEKEMAKYVISITTRIDLIDEHIHHLDLN